MKCINDNTLKQMTDEPHRTLISEYGDLLKINILLTEMNWLGNKRHGIK